MKKLLWLLVLFLFLPVALADWSSHRVCDSGENCTITVFVVQDADVTVLADANCTIDVYNSTRALNVTGAGMTRDGLGLYSYVVNYDVVGHYPAYVECHNSTADIKIMSSGKHVADDKGDTVDVSFDVVVNDGWMLAVLLPILAVVFVFAYFSIRMDQLHYFIKVLLFLGSLALTIVAVNVGRIFVEMNNGGQGLLTLLNTANFVLIILLIVITATLIIYFIAELLWGIAQTKFGKTP